MMTEGKAESREEGNGGIEVNATADTKTDIDVSVTSLEMSDGTTVPVPRGGVIVFVGPNNAGKSLSLREIAGHIGSPGLPPRAVKSLKIEKGASEEDLFAWLEKHAVKTQESGYAHYQRVGRGRVQEAMARMHWQSGPPFREVGDMLTFYATGESRLRAAHGNGNIDYETVSPNAPLHFVYLDPDLEKKISDVSVRAFRQPLVLDTHSGTMLYLRLGQAPPSQTGPTGRPSREYQGAIRSLPVLDEQGDGMKSFMGLALNILVSVYPFVLVDEPEAFLHPPQARLLGRLLADEKDPDAQVFVATHDSDVLTGLLDSTAENITVVRLVRDREVNQTSQLAPERVRDLWNDPILRYSNILDGLFHEAVVLCESDADCRFYASVLDAMEEDTDEARRPEFLFTHCGGKHRMPTVIEALRAVNVPVRVVADFDILRDKALLQRIVEGLSGDWALFENDWSVVKSALDANTRGPSTAFVREEIGKLLGGVTTPRLEKKDVENMRQLTKTESGWDKAKRDGKSAVPRGDAAARVERMLPALREIGLFVVEVGELEGFAPTVGGHGPDWVNAVHERGLHADKSLTEACDFVRSVAGNSPRLQ